MKAFRISGKMRVTPNNWQKFSKEFVGKSEKDAVEMVYSIMGSKHKVERKFLIINDVTELKPEEIEDPVVKYKIENGA